jgi:3-deoxy-7-phosphoheptulonate synthase
MIPTPDLHTVDTRPLVPPLALHRELPIIETAARTVQCARNGSRRFCMRKFSGCW